MDHVAPISQYYADAAAGKLPSVSFVDPIFIGAPNTETDEHPSSNVQVGQNFAYNVVNGPQYEPELVGLGHVPDVRRARRLL